MVVKSFFYFLLFCLISLSLCVLGFIVIYYFQSKEIANQFFLTWTFYFNGILVGGTGYGLMWYIKDEGNNLLAMLNNLIDISKFDNLKLVVYSQRANSWRWKNIVGIPITIIGVLVLWNEGYPLQGFAKYYLAVCSMSIYYVAAYIFTFFIFVLLMFKAIEENLHNNNISKKVAALDFESINNFFAITSTLGIAAIYFGFRGTLTANFDLSITQEPLRKFLILPVVLFLPITLLYSFYPRYILKKIFDLEILNQVKDLERLKSVAINEGKTIKEKLEIEKIISDVKEKLLSERKQLPIISYKDSPSLLLVILMILHFIIQYDNTINSFFKIF